ncbi:UDP-N-acetylenolpyruvoylglucosamine reductase [Capnocytophaga canimorsus]|uniref:UDP-N-acetylenolpyruvoylglucosamine reductase n=1 Tax=Capnocytophaga canimorsus TaxID=28188 RepID=A0AAC9Z390_9FLAO|nr:UDP-N-acetylmuramate dehydrogenase [Capnocytophaga canimorsus]ATA93763.1 UDP-N-acetylenolpyruvoylglucosamine reductase [Capnocytophaga canimorsus]
MNILKNISLKPYNSFGIDVIAETFVEITSEADLKQALKLFPKCFVLGGGSNMLLTKDIATPVLHIQNKGISIIKEDSDFIWIKAEAGENWHKFVLFCLEKGYGGLENLALIPGNVGTTPVQNIGAYGVEIKDVMESCQAINTQNFQNKTFTNSDCHFAYRESIFKTTEKGNYIITSVTFKLTKQNHILNIHYGDIQKVLAEKGISSPTPSEIAQAVMTIRKQKLPDPKTLGNSGSFFKNPIVNQALAEQIRNQYPQMPYYEMPEARVKIPAGWLIETCGFKGYRQGDAGVHKNQALVLVNYGKASGTDIWNLAITIQQKVKNTFGIDIEPEVNVFM